MNLCLCRSSGLSQNTNLLSHLYCKSLYCKSAKMNFPFPVSPNLFIIFKFMSALMLIPPLWQLCNSRDSTRRCLEADKTVQLVKAKVKDWEGEPSRQPLVLCRG